MWPKVAVFKNFLYKQQVKLNPSLIDPFLQLDTKEYLASSLRIYPDHQIKTFHRPKFTTVFF